MHRVVWLSLLLAACGKADNDWVTPTPAADASGAAMTITGVVHHFELEGGFYAIRGDDSVTYDPTTGSRSRRWSGPGRMPSASGRSAPWWTSSESGRGDALHRANPGAVMFSIERSRAR